MRIENGHAHATSRYTNISDEDYRNLLSDICIVKEKKYKSLTVHLPLEIQHPHVYKKKNEGLRFIQFGECLKNFFRIKLYWENAPEEVTGEWSLRYGQTDWTYVPHDIAICFDVGHCMIGAHDKDDAKKRIQIIFAKRGKQIKHLHIHENDFFHDTHQNLGHILTHDFIKPFLRKRTYIFEKGE